MTVYGEEQLEQDDVMVVEPERPSKYVRAEREEDTSKSLLDELAEVAEKALDGTVKFRVDEELRPGGWVLEFSKVVSAREIRNWARAGTRGKKLDAANIDSVKVNGLALVEKNVGIYKGDQQIFDDDGDALTVTSSVWLEKVCKQSPKNYDALAGLVHFLGDAQIIKMGTQLTREAGYSDDLEAVDPT